MELLSEELHLLKLGDSRPGHLEPAKTSTEIRELGGALFGNRRYHRVFVYQKSAKTYSRVRASAEALRV